MAKLSHPNVVAVYDAEERPETGETGLALVMEYVPGGTLRAWLDAETRSWRSIVDVFIAAGRGLVAAHREGLLHRDFKPTNVLVSHDAAVKVTDFGLAKATGDPNFGSSRGTSEDGTTDSSITRAGMVMGTPRYMAPEQHHGEPLSPQADQYAFCVALREALTGEPPFAGPDLSERKQAGPPPWPRSDVPATVTDAVQRGLAADPDQRWASLEQLLEQLDRARHPRHRGRLALAGTIGLLGVGAVVSPAWVDDGSRRCTGAREQLAAVWDAERKSTVRQAFERTGLGYVAGVWSRTESRLDAYADAWVEMHTESCEATTLRGEQSSETMDLRMACLHRAKLELDAVVDVLATADADVVGKAHETLEGLPVLAKCADIEQLRSGVDPPPADEAEMVDRVRSKLSTSRALTFAGKHEEAVEVSDATLRDVQSLRYQPIRAEVLVERGRLLSNVGRLDEAETVLREALTQAARLQQRDEMQRASQILLRTVGALQQKPVQALRYRELAEALAGPEDRSDLAEALAATLTVAGRFDEAEAQLRTALELDEATWGPDHPRLATLHTNLGIALMGLQRFDEAEAEFRQTLALRQRILGQDHPETIDAELNLGSMLVERGDAEAAEEALRNALHRLEAAYGPEHPAVADALNNLANALNVQGKFAQAEPLLLRSVRLGQSSATRNDAALASYRTNLAWAYEAQDKYAEAIEQYEAALATRRKDLGASHVKVVRLERDLADVLLRAGKSDEALAVMERAWPSIEHNDQLPLAAAADIAFVFARIEAAVHGPSSPAALDWADRAIGTYAEAGETYETERMSVKAFRDGLRP
jgi:serine/threonine-protein kinase